MSYSIRTRCVAGEGGYAMGNSTAAIAAPIYQSATFVHSSLEEAKEAGKESGAAMSVLYSYSRLQNPTRESAERLAASLEEAKYGFAFSSGMAAISAVFDTFCNGDAVIASEDLYGGAIRLFNTLERRNGINIIYTDTTSVLNIENALKKAQETGYHVAAVYIETPSNPMMLITDIKEAGRIAHKNGALLIVDNTFLTPYFQRPLDLGADIAVQSATKFLCGHNDTLAGIVTTNNDEAASRLAFNAKTTGAGLSPFDSFLLIRGIKTLSVRLERQQQNAIEIVKALQKIPYVTKVLYPGLEEHPGFAVHKAQSSGFGSMVSFYVDSEERAECLLNHVRLIRFAESLGGVESLITYPITQTHADVPVAERERRGINVCLLRLSVGIEDSTDLIADIEQAASSLL